MHKFYVKKATHGGLAITSHPPDKGLIAGPFDRHDDAFDYLEEVEDRRRRMGVYWQAAGLLFVLAAVMWVWP